MPDLTEADYDALFAAMKYDMPRTWRELFPKISIFPLKIHFTESIVARQAPVQDLMIAVRSVLPFTCNEEMGGSIWRTCYRQARSTGPPETNRIATR
jgi:hypothetical protein